MTLEQSIIKDLAHGQSTADALALRMGRRRDTVEAILQRMDINGDVMSMEICNGKFTVWRLRAKKCTLKPL
jgi:hypothetical protein